jgi:hypothetical protein
MALLGQVAPEARAVLYDPLRHVLDLPNIGYSHIDHYRAAMREDNYVLFNNSSTIHHNNWDNMDRKNLEQVLMKRFGCSSSEARAIFERAIKLKSEVESDPNNWDSLSEIDPDYIVSRLDTAPDQLSVTAKWNWWASVMNLSELDQEYKIS